MKQEQANAQRAKLELGGRDRDRGRDWNRDRDLGRDLGRDRGRDRDLARDRDVEGAGDRGRDRDLRRDRDLGRDRNRDRDVGRDRDLGRDHTHGVTSEELAAAHIYMLAAAQEEVARKPYMYDTVAV